jgi:predicted phage gp36 major capsid-like protein
MGMTNKMVLPINATGPSISYADGNYPSEGVGPTAETGVALTSKSLDTKTLLVLDTVSLELGEDSLVAIEPLLAQIFGEAIALEENRQAFNSTNPFTGVSNTSGIGYYYLGNTYNSGKTAFSQLTHADLVGTQFKVDSKLIHRGVWVCNPAFFQHCVGLKDANGRPIYATNYTGGMLPGFQTDGSNPDMQATAPAILLGRPCFLTEAMNGTSGAGKVAAIYGDFRYHAMGLRKDLSVEWNDSVYFNLGVSAVRLRQRYAMVTLIPSAFASLRTADS